jgi:large subunit ribosomal protein L17
MAAQGRKNVHGKTGVRFRTAYKPEKNKGMLRDVVSELIAHDKVEVTSGVTKDLVSLASRLVGYAKKGDLSARRMAARYTRPIVVDEKGTTVLEKLFTVIGPKYKARNGGYVRVYKLGHRRGDNAEVTLVQWVD